MRDLDRLKLLSEDELRAEIASKTPQEGDLLETFWGEPDTVQAVVNLTHHVSKHVSLIGGNMSNKTQHDFNESDFQDEYQSKVLDLGSFNGYPFLVTVQEIPHGKYTKLQQNFIGKMHLSNDAAAHQRQMAEKEVDPIEFVENRNLAGIQSWTLKTKANVDIPVCERAWQLLPHRLTERIEKGIAEVNPTLQADFRDELESTGGDMGKPDETGETI
jgi:hypothetical protein